MLPVLDLIAEDGEDLVTTSEGHTEAADETFLPPHRESQERECRSYMDRFFANRMLRCGLPVPKSLLYTQENYDLLLDGDSENFDGIYQELGTLGRREAGSADSVPWDVRLVITMLTECARAGVPKQMASGMVQIYIRLCYRAQGLRVAN